MRKELSKQFELLEQKMSKSPNNIKDGGSHFLYRRERMIRFKMLQKNMQQKMLNLTKYKPMFLFKYLLLITATLLEGINLPNLYTATPTEPSPVLIKQIQFPSINKSFWLQNPTLPLFFEVAPTTS